MSYWMFTARDTKARSGDDSQVNLLMKKFFISILFIMSLSAEAADPQDLADKWREKAEIEGHRLWEKFQTTLSVVIEADKATTRFANTDS
jgi:hypothetical protein